MSIALAVLLAALPIPCAQQPAGPAADIRGRAFGLVRDREGKPWASAQVTLLSRPLPSIEQVGSEDRIEVVTDDRGRFRANVLPNRPYSVWAIQSTGDVYRHTDIAENVFPNVAVILEEAGDPRPTVRLTVQGMEAWENAGPLRFQVVGSAINRTIEELSLDNNGELLIPPLAGPSNMIEVYSAGGQPLLEHLVSLRATDTRALSIPPPFPILVEVKDKAGTKPLAGTRILQRVRQGWAVVAETGADGIAVLNLPLERAEDGRAIWVHRVLMAEADDYSPGSLITVKMDLGRDKDPAILRAAGQVDAYAGLELAPMLRGRVLLASGVPAAHTDLVVYGRYASFREGSSTAGPLIQFSKTDGEGRFATPSPVTTDGFRLCAVLNEVQLIELFGHGQQIPHPLALLAHDSQRVSPGGTLGELRIDRLCPLDITVTHEDRTPAPHAVLAYAEHLDRNSQDLPPCNFVADRHGRQRILIPTTDELLVGALHEGAGQVLSTELTANGGLEMPLTLDVVLRPPQKIQGRVFISTGDPLPGAEISCFPSYLSRPSTRTVRANVRPPAAGTNTLRIVGDNQWEANWALTSQLLLLMTANSDENGDFFLSVPSNLLQYYVRATYRTDTRARTSSTVAVRFHTDDVQEVELTIELR